MIFIQSVAFFKKDKCEDKCLLDASKYIGMKLGDKVAINPNFILTIETETITWKGFTMHDQTITKIYYQGGTFQTQESPLSLVRRINNFLNKGSNYQQELDTEINNL